MNERNSPSATLRVGLEQLQREVEDQLASLPASPARAALRVVANHLQGAATAVRVFTETTA